MAESAQLGPTAARSAMTPLRRKRPNGDRRSRFCFRCAGRGDGAPYTEHTQKDHLRHVRRFASFLGRSPHTASSEDVRRYQLQMAKDQIGCAEHQ